MKQKGFTLLELLVVISIIGLLASVVLVSLSSARGKARDAKRIADKKQVVTALNLYYNANNAWPTVGAWTCFGGLDAETCSTGSIKNGNTALVTAMSPYMSSFPINNADTATMGYNRIQYHSTVAADYFPGIPAGAWIFWMQENDMSSSVCPPAQVTHPDKYYYCFEFLGAP